MKIGDKFTAGEVFHDGAIGSDVEMRALIVDSEGRAVFAYNPANKYTYIFDMNGPDDRSDWINYGLLTDFLADVEAVVRLAR
jgi:hypothetical protein